MPDVQSLRIPLKYLANLLTAGDERAGRARAGAHAGDARLHARQDRRWRDRRQHRASGSASPGSEIEDMYHVMAIANYEDRFVIPTAHRETRRGRLSTCAAPAASRFGNGCSAARPSQPVRPPASKAKTPMEVV